MNSFKSLTNVFNKSIAMSTIPDKKKRIIFNTLLFTTVFLIFIPFLFICGIFVYSMTNTLDSVGLGSIGLELVIGIISIFTFFFSFNVVLNQFYFSNDIETLLSLPIKSEIIVASKFASCFIAENVMQFLLMFFSITGFSLAMKLNLFKYLLAVFGIITIPLIPMIYCSIISLIIMNFTKFIKNKETVRKIGVLTSVIILLIFILSLGFLQQFDFDNYIKEFALGNHETLNVLRVIFPHIKLFVDTVVDFNIISLLLYIVVNVLFIGLFLLLSKYLYIDSVIGLSSRDNKNNISSNELLRLSKQKSKLRAYINKEFIVLFRSPTYFINCVLINFIWPLFIFVIYKICFNTVSLSTIRDMVGSDSLYTIILIFVVSVSLLVSSLNSIASSSYSREGSSFSFMKYIPMSYEEQTLAKIVVSFVISFVGINIFATIFYMVIGISLIDMFSFYFISLLGVLFTSLLGVLIDSIQPKLIWDDEANSLRENYNTFLCMGFSLLMFIIHAGGSYLMYKHNVDYITILLSNIIILIVINYGLMSMINNSIGKNLLLQEEL